LASERARKREREREGDMNNVRPREVEEDAAAVDEVQAVALGIEPEEADGDDDEVDGVQQGHHGLEPVVHREALTARTWRR
jgi:hypothetical protein